MEQQVNPERVAIYIRWSTDEQSNGTSLQVQRDSCRYFLQFKGWAFQEELVFIDDGYSGGNIDRPAMTKLRKAVADGRVECVVVYKLDRLSRRLLDAVRLVREEWVGKCSLFSTQENIDTVSAVGQMVFNILVSFAEFERNLIKDRTASGRYKRAENGRKAGSGYPYGYRGGPNKEWELDGWDEPLKCFTGAAAIVRRIFDEYLGGRGWNTIAEGLRADGLKSPRGKMWRGDTISRILTNPVYTGLYQYGNKTHQGRKTPGPHIEVDGCVPPIVTKAEFAQVERIRRDRGSAAPRTLGAVHLLSGVARCAMCGGPMKSTKNNRGDWYYICTTKVNLGTCQAASIRQDALDKAVLDQVKRMLSKENLTSQIDQIQAGIRQQTAERAGVVRALEEELTRLERLVQRMEDDYANGQISGQTFSKAFDKVEGSRLEVQERLAAAKMALHAAEAVTVDRDRLRRLSVQVDAWSKLEREEIKQILRDVIERLEVSREPGRGGRGKANQNPIYIRWYPRTDIYVAADGEADTAAD